MGSAKQPRLDDKGGVRRRYILSKAYKLRAAIVGFNLPFDISRLAIRHAPARSKKMRGGFTFKLSSDKRNPRVQIKHLNARASLIQFTKPPKKFDTRSMRKIRIATAPRRGSFLDVKTIALALTSQSCSLATLADFLETKHQKLSNEEHGGPLTTKYLGYALNDVQVTWECYTKLGDKFNKHGLARGVLSRILSEAGLGKAYLDQMNIKPWREVQPDFPDHLTGIIMSTYFGGRSEVHLRRLVALVLYCDFQSMYPTVCALMGLWRFIIAKGITHRENTAEVRSFLEHVTLADMQNPETWRELATIVQIIPDDDVFPIRAKYADELQATIGLNYGSSRRRAPLWLTLADCISSKLLTGKVPTIIQAMSFAPADVQDGLKRVAIVGNKDYTIDPRKDDFFKRMNDARNEVKAKMKRASGHEAARLDAEQQSIKIIANATSYGIFVEQIVEELDSPEHRMCFGSGSEPFQVSTAKGEKPGRYFHPLIATLITGAARLMLAITEVLASLSGLEWAFCDTDSMALAKPADMGNAEFMTLARDICDWFKPLNPYAKKGALFKIEDANYEVADGRLTDKLEPLFCFAVSAKRYVLLNKTPDGNIKIRKASAHGLGHLLPPYAEADAPAEIPPPCVSLSAIGVHRWQYDLWYKIICAALDGHPDQVDLGYHPALDQPAASRYVATTPKQLRWFKTFNKARPPSDQVRPFNFLLAFQASPSTLIATDLVNGANKKTRKKHRKPKPIAPNNKDICVAAWSCFDRVGCGPDN
jgi:hypothetical protein